MSVLLSREHSKKQVFS